LDSKILEVYYDCKGLQNIEQKDNIPNQNFSATSINQKWYTDITYIHTEKEGWTLLGSIEDLYSRKIID